jgi:tRNA(Ile)-lysidine synthase TilS/MesJ
MRAHTTRQGRVVALCDYCCNTIEFIGLSQAEEKVSAKGWSVRHGKTRCTACSERERQVLARALTRFGADLSLLTSLAEFRSE